MNLYAWTNSNVGTVYTISETPSVGDSYYKSNGEPYEQYELQGDNLAFLSVISAVEDGTISITGDPT